MHFCSLVTSTLSAFLANRLKLIITNYFVTCGHSKCSSIMASHSPIHAPIHAPIHTHIHTHIHTPATRPCNPALPSNHSLLLLALTNILLLVRGLGSGMQGAGRMYSKPSLSHTFLHGSGKRADTVQCNTTKDS